MEALIILGANSWLTRERRYLKKFDAGKKYIKDQYAGIKLPDEIDQVAIFTFASNLNHLILWFIYSFFDLILKESPFLASLFGAIKVQSAYQSVENIDLVDKFTTTYGTL